MLGVSGFLVLIIILLVLLGLLGFSWLAVWLSNNDYFGGLH